jgi:raffinose/stachyose/melibiose transport system permease protein
MALEQCRLRGGIFTLFAMNHLVNFLRNIPDELYESMRADGAGRWRMLVNLALSLSRPALITVTIYDALNVWNGFLFPLILTQSPDNRVLPLFVWGFQGEFTINIPAILASVVLSTLPILALYVLGRRRHRRTHGGLRQMRNRSGREQERTAE